MKSFRFVHAADLHLDSPFRGLRRTDEGLGTLLARSTFDAYERIVDLCIERGVDALLVAGDIYDGADRSLRAQLAFQAGLQRLSTRGIRVFIAHGNHDPLDGWQARLAMPEGCHRFASEPESIALDPSRPQWVTVHGVSFAQRVVSENLASRFRAAESAINVGVLHATVGTQEGHDPYAPCSLADLERSGMDYWALGHVHERQVLRAEAPAVVYPGNPQGRHVREAGARGVYVVELAPGRRPTLEFLPVDVVRWSREHLDIASIESEQALLDACLAAARSAALKAEGRYLLVVLRLDGAGPIRDSLRRDGFLDEMLEHLNRQLESAGRRAQIVDFEDRTGAGEPADAGGLTFMAELLRAGHTAADDPDLIDALQHDLDELQDRRAVRRQLTDLMDARELVAAATERAYEALKAAAR